jgi:hypothetical protein
MLYFVYFASFNFQYLSNYKNVTGLEKNKGKYCNFAVEL